MTAQSGFPACEYSLSGLALSSQVRGKELFDLVPGDAVVVRAAVVEVAASRIGDGEEDLVVRVYAFTDLLESVPCHVERVCLFSVHDHDGILNLIDVVQEAGICIGLCTNGIPPVVGVE